MYHPFIVGKSLYLRGIEKKDLSENFFQWANDSNITEYMEMGLRPNSLELLEEEYNKLIRSSSDVAFIIMVGNKSIGSCGLYSINWISRKAEVRIIIGEKGYQNRCIGIESIKLLIDYAFNKLNLNKVYLGVNEENLQAVNCYKKAGFIEEGILRDEIFRNNKYYNAIRMSILRKDV